MKIKSWVPQAMNNSMPPSFGRTDASRGNSVEKKTQINDSSKRRENRYVDAPGHGRTDYNHVWSLRRTDIGFCSILCAFLRYAL